MPHSASRLRSWIWFSCLCVLRCAAFISSSSLPPSLPFFAAFFHFLCFFSLRLCVRARCTRGCGCVLKASLHTHQGGSLLFHTQTMTCTFLSCLTRWPRACESVTWWNGILYKIFTECLAQGNTCFACNWLFSLVCCYCFISSCEWYIISPAGRCEPVVSFMISIDEFSLGESISRGCSLVAQPPPLAVPDSCLGCLTFPAAP